MFKEKEFSEILQKIINSYDSITEFSERSEVNRTYLSKYINMKLENPPAPRILGKIADNSKKLTTYDELMQICGYTEETIEEVCSSILTKLNNVCSHFTNHPDDMYEIPSSIESFSDYVNDLIRNLNFPVATPIKLTDYYNKENFIEDNSYVIAFLFIYDSFLHQLLNKSYIENLKYNFVDWDNYDEIYEQFYKLDDMELLSFSNSFVNIIDSQSSKIIDYAQKFNMCLRFAYASTFDNNKLIQLFNSKISNSKTVKDTTSDIPLLSKQFYNCPVYGKISAGLPNWAEECLEGYLPIDPNLMGIINPEECFFLRVDGESMNKVIRNGAYALIRKQDTAEDGDIVVAIVNGNNEATLKKFKRFNEQFVSFEPLSSDDSFKPINVDLQTTNVIILGKYIGKFEMN